MSWVATEGQAAMGVTGSLVRAYQAGMGHMKDTDLAQLKAFRIPTTEPHTH